MDSTILLTFAIQLGFLSLLVFGLRFIYLKQIERTNGASPRLPGEAKWASIPQANVYQAKREVFSSSLFWFAYLLPLLILSVLYQTTAIGEARGFMATATRIAIVLIALYIGQIILAGAIRKKLNIN